MPKTHEFDELDVEEMRECWKCNRTLTDENRFRVEEFHGVAYYCKACAGDVLEEIWNQGDSIKAKKESPNA